MSTRTLSYQRKTIFQAFLETKTATKQLPLQRFAYLLLQKRSCRPGSQQKQNSESLVTDSVNKEIVHLTNLQDCNFVPTHQI